MKKIIFISFLTLALPAFCFASTLFDNYAGEINEGNGINGRWYTGQSWQAQSSYTLSSVKIWAYKLDCLGQDFPMYLNLRNAGNDILASSTLSSLPLTGSYSQVEFSFSGYPIMSGSSYLLDLNNPTREDCEIRIGGDSTNGYAYGNRINSADSGASWSGQYGDMVFSNYGAGSPARVSMITIPAELATSALAQVSALVFDYKLVLALLLAFLLIKPAINLVFWIVYRTPFNKDK